LGNLGGLGGIKDGTTATGPDEVCNALANRSCIDIDILNLECKYYF